jgi:hypothetical protein
MLGHQRIGDSAVFPESTGSANFVEAHEPRVPGHISGHYRRQPASDPAWLHFGHGTQTLRAALCTINPAIVPFTCIA